MGIPIGPDTSWLLGEIIMIAVEEHLEAAHPGVQAFRYLDDIEVVCSSASEAETVLRTLEEGLAVYELSLNPRKTDVRTLPDRIEPDGVAELRRWRFSQHPKRQLSDAIAYFDRLSELRSSDPATSASTFGLARLQGVSWHQTVWEVVQSSAASVAINEPSVLKSFAKLVAAGQARGLPIDRSVLGLVVNQVLLEAAPLGRDSEVVWALWLAIEHQVPIPKKASRLLRHVNESCGVLMALLAGRRGLLNRQPDRAEWRSAMTTDELDSSRWLLSYEARQQGWLRSAGGGDHRKQHPLFRQLAAAGVSFLDISAQVQPTFPIGAAGPSWPGGAGGGGYGAPA